MSCIGCLGFLKAGAPGWIRGRAGLLLAEGGLAVFAAEVAAAPDAGTDPDGGDADDEDDNHDDPLPVVGDPKEQR